MEYDVATGVSKHMFLTSVDELLKEGFVPLGGIAADHAGFYQAMVKVNVKSD